MGTKTDPGEFDCYGKAEPDEPLFTLRAKDPLAPVLVRLWCGLRAAMAETAEDTSPARAAHETRKRREGLECARQMEEWRRSRAGGRTGAQAAGEYAMAGRLLRNLDAQPADEKPGPPAETSTEDAR